MMVGLIEELRQSGALIGELPPQPDGAPVSRWIVALQVVGAWLASFFLLGFIGLAAAIFIRSGSDWAVVGVLATGGAVLGLRAVSGMVGRQFFLALSLAGQAAFAFGIADELGWKHSEAWWSVAVFEAAVAVAVAWRPHRLLAALLMLGAVHLALVEPFQWLDSKVLDGEVATGWMLSVYWAAACGLWLLEPNWRTLRWADLLASLAIALSLYCLLSVLTQFTIKVSFFGLLWKERETGVMLVVISFIYLALCGRSLWKGGRGVALFASLLGLCAVTWQAPGIAVGFAALVIGFGGGRRWLLWLGGAVLLAAIGCYYYSLQIDLLQKSGLLVFAGGILLGLRALLGTEARQ